ncbi:DUF6085 family protein [Micromonospora chalcea]
MPDRTFRLETRDERGLIIRIDVRTVSTFDEFMAAAATIGAEVLPRHGEGGHAAVPAHNLAAFRAAREWAAEHGHQQPDDRMLQAYGEVLLASLDISPRHIIDFRADGWTIQHPLACRPDLFNCPVNRVAGLDLSQLDGPPVPPGRYECSANDLGDRFLLGNRIDQAEG